MHYVKFNVDENRYLMPTNDVIEIIPFVQLTSKPTLPETIPGMCDYRGNSVPVIDLSYLLLKRPSNKKLSTRIIIFEMISNKNIKNLIGIIVEKATEVMKVDDESFMDSKIYGEDAPINGQVMTDAAGFMARILPKEIISKIDSDIFFNTH